MMNKLRDPMSASIIAIISLVVAIFGAWFAWRALTSKGVAYEIISQTPLISSQETVAGRLQVSFDGKTVENVSLVVLRVYNSGNTEIRKSDYESPIEFSFGQSADILSAEIVKTTPVGIPASLSYQDNYVVISPTLLNSNDTIEFRAIVSKMQENIVVSCRIAGVSNCVLVDPRNQFSWTTLIISALVGAGLTEIATRGLRVFNRVRKAEKELREWHDLATEIITESKRRREERENKEAEIEEMLGIITQKQNELTAEIKEISTIADQTETEPSKEEVLSETPKT